MLIALTYVKSNGERVTNTLPFASTWAALDWASCRGAVVAFAKRVPA